MNKTCTKCGESKPHSEYYKHGSTRDRLHPACKSCMKAARNAWYQENREANLEYQREWREANPDLKRAASRAWWEANRDRHRANVKANADAKRDELRAYSKKHYQENPEIRQRLNAKRRAQKAEVEHQPYKRRDIYNRDGGKCRLCNVDLAYEPRAFHIDHIVPISLGGPDTPGNVQLTCPTCNLRKQATLEGQIHFAA